MKTVNNVQPNAYGIEFKPDLNYQQHQEPSFTWDGIPKEWADTCVLSVFLIL